MDDIDTETVLREPVAAVLPAGHRLAERGDLTLAELADEPWVLTTRSSWPPWHKLYDREFAAAGFEPRVVQRGTTPLNLLALVAAGVGVTRLTMSSRSLRDTGVAFVPLKDDVAEVVLAWKAGSQAPALARFAEVVRDVAVGIDPVATG